MNGRTNWAKLWWSTQFVDWSKNSGARANSANKQVCRSSLY